MIEQKEIPIILLEKIEKLFHYRALPKLLELATIDIDQKITLWDNLILLQANIYFLDEELEKKYCVDYERLDEKWAEIYDALNLFGIKQIDKDDYLADIKRYEKHELSLREGNQLLRLPLEYFYYFKSCDVKLIRNLIYDRYTHLYKLLPIESWKIFDLVTEINDDIEDIYEDANLTNGNRFLLEIRSKGIENTCHHFQTYIEGLIRRLNENDQISPEVEFVTSIARKACHDTLNLLQLRKNELMSTKSHPKFSTQIVEI